jgi:hypothetical protein
LYENAEEREVTLSSGILVSALRISSEMPSENYSLLASFRMFGDTVWFADDGTVLARHNNIIDPYITGLKGDLTIFDVPSPP